MENLIFPVGCQSAKDRIEFCYNASEKLRIIHNLIGKWYREGISIEEYNGLPDCVKMVFKYKSQITKTEFDRFFKDIFRKFEDAISLQIGEQRKTLKNSQKWNIDMNGLLDGY